MLEKLEEILRTLKRDTTGPENQNALFEVTNRTPTIEIQTADTTPLGQKLSWEKELLGIYVSGHPTDQYRDALKEYEHSIRNARKETRKGYPFIIGGVVEQAKKILTKKGEHMGFFTIADSEEKIEAVAFPKTYQEVRDILEVGNCVLLKGKISHRNDEPSILIDKVKKVG